MAELVDAQDLKSCGQSNARAGSSPAPGTVAHYLVTGGAGFIGSHIVKTLIEKGEKVTVLDNLSTGTIENLKDVLSEITFIEGDIRSYHVVLQAMNNVDYVLHQAALPSVARSVKDPITSNAVNVEGTLNVLYAAKEKGVKRVVFASSSSIYGEQPQAEKKETMCPNPQSPYAVSKYAAERYCLLFYKLYGLETVALRYFNIFGPHQRADSPYAAVIPKFIDRMLKGLPPIIYGDGKQTRDFTYIDNCVEANLLACKQPGIAGKVFNIGCGEQHNLLELVQYLNELLGTSLTPEFAPPRKGDVKHSKANIQEAQKHLGYKVKVSFYEGLQKVVAYKKYLFSSV